MRPFAGVWDAIDRVDLEVICDDVRRAPRQHPAPWPSTLKGDVMVADVGLKLKG